MGTRVHWPKFTDVDKASEIFGCWVKIKDDHWHHIDYLSGSKISSIFEESDSAIKSDQIWPISDQNTRIWSKGNPAHDLTLEETYLQNVRKIWQNFVVNLMITVWRSRVLWIQVTPRGSQWTLVKVCCSQAAQSAHMQQLPSCTTPPCTTPACSILLMN